MGNWNSRERRRAKLEAYVESFNHYYSKEEKDFEAIEDLLISIWYFKDSEKIQVELRKIDKDSPESLERNICFLEKSKGFPPEAQDFSVNPKFLHVGKPELGRFSDEESHARSDRTRMLENTEKHHPTLESPNSTKKTVFSEPADQLKCVNCKAQNKITQECEHGLCSSCTETLYISQSKGSYLGSFKCGLCGASIKIANYIEPNKLYKLRLASISKLELAFAELTSSIFNCEICGTELPVSESITLSCDHRFCQYCIEQHVESIVKTSNISSLKCPQCECIISYEEIKANVSPTTFSLYEKKLLRDHRPDNQCFYLKECFFCGTFSEIPRTLTSFKCPGCSKTYCPQCNGLHAGSKCDYSSFKADIDYQQCPNCSEAVSKEKGCNFVQCHCGTYFCYICRQVLDKSMHFQHYSRQGPFGTTCNTVDRLT